MLYNAQRTTIFGLPYPVLNPMFLLRVGWLCECPVDSLSKPLRFAPSSPLLSGCPEQHLEARCFQRTVHDYELPSAIEFGRSIRPLLRSEIPTGTMRDARTVVDGVDVSRRVAQVACG